MPQMAPTIWLPLFTLIVLLMFLVKSSLYFTSNKNYTQTTPKNNYFNTNWLW